ncbi:uncharacterized protein KY384_007337 [Bacidia gigantensis]|uniref:uncharacterized protein n=1 Tax=Bacidia gigantensis TaxID=2732470 RepID=UPI001D056020|nr:uncharacterized protein KY384_007337 [Bacidia gigantensis]KAG8528419.1 hypothetical protein KY384_007337 [Bacidia gigantensis]
MTRQQYDAAENMHRAMDAIDGCRGRKRSWVDRHKWKELKDLKWLEDPRVSLCIEYKAIFPDVILSMDKERDVLTINQGIPYVQGIGERIRGRKRGKQIIWGMIEDVGSEEGS